MPPRASLQNSFSVASSESEVVCPLRNQDGSSCRKRCLGDKRFRSMQEHIRRAHPEYYLPKLPATQESFELMISTPPHERPPQDTHGNPIRSLPPPPHSSDPPGLSPAFNLDHAAGLNSFEGYHALGQHDGGYYTAGDAEAAAIYNSMQAQQRSSDEYRRGSLIPAASAAAALAQLHYHRPESDWGGDNIGQNFYADQNHDLKPNHFNVDPTLDETPFIPDHGAFPVSTGQDHQSGLLSGGGLPRSPPDRPSALTPLQRSLSRTHASRPRKSSISQQARLAKHERKRSKELARRSSGDKKVFPADSGTQAPDKRWQDLLEAATSATEDGSRDLTPIPASPYQSPQVASRTSLPPFTIGSQFQSFQASPLQRALTPPGPDTGLADLQNFPSVDSTLSTNLSHSHHNSADSSGSQFHILNPNSMDSNSSPMFGNQPVQIYCAGCRRLTLLKDSFACTNCICGLCGNCVEAIISGQSRGRMSMCPRCNGMDSSFKPFQLDLR